MLGNFCLEKKGGKIKITERSVIRSRVGGGTEHHSITLDLPAAHRVAHPYFEVDLLEVVNIEVDLEKSNMA